MIAVYLTKSKQRLSEDLSGVYGGRSGISDGEQKRKDRKMGLKSWIAKMAVNYAKPLIKAELTVDKMAGYAVDGVDYLTAGTIFDEKISDREKVANLIFSHFFTTSQSLSLGSRASRTASPIML